jgi:hypothetical protein
MLPEAHPKMRRPERADLSLPRSCRGAVRFLQLPGAVVTTDLDSLAADFDFEGISI